MPCATRGTEPPVTVNSAKEKVGSLKVASLFFDPAVLPPGAVASITDGGDRCFTAFAHIAPLLILGERIWLVTFMHYDLGYFDDEVGRLEPIANPFGPKVLPMCSE